jgi:hypothetical protein
MSKGFLCAALLLIGTAAHAQDKPSRVYAHTPPERILPVETSYSAFDWTDLNEKTVLKISRLTEVKDYGQRTAIADILDEAELPHLAELARSGLKAHVVNNVKPTKKFVDKKFAYDLDAQVFALDRVGISYTMLQVPLDANNTLFDRVVLEAHNQGALLTASKKVGKGYLGIRASTSLFGDTAQATITYTMPVDDAFGIIWNKMPWKWGQEYDRGSTYVSRYPKKEPMKVPKIFKPHTWFK